MKAPVLVFTFLFCFLWGRSQKVQTIVPSQVIAGNAFQIQYIIRDPANFINITGPQFDNLQLVSGPNYYKGTSLVNGKQEQIQNITFTVVPLKPGRGKVNAITATFKNNEEQKSDDIVLTVLPQPKASFNTTSTYTDVNLYAPSSKTDLDKLIEANLFIKTEIDKHVCFLGEAITATFKLYSRLQSTSEVINAPSLYGFSVMDILDINEAHQAVETIGGKIFNTSILRKLQLFPAQTGKLTIDPMQLQNSIEFSDSLTGKRVQLDKQLASQPVEVVVKTLPLKQPQDYTGAVGEYNISATLANSNVQADAQGKLVVTVTGKGNFLQFGPPIVNWPKGFEVIEAVVSDEINKQLVPVGGKRTYTYSFTTDQEGIHTIAPISFSYFNPHTGHFNTVRTDSFRIVTEPARQTSFQKPEEQVFKAGKATWIYVTLLSVLAIVALVLWRRRKPPVITLNERPRYLEELDSLSLRSLSDKEFFISINKLLERVSKELSVSDGQQQELLAIQKECQLLIYTEAREVTTREEMQGRTADLLKRIFI